MKLMVCDCDDGMEGFGPHWILRCNCGKDYNLQLNTACDACYERVPEDVARQAQFLLRMGDML